MIVKWKDAALDALADIYVQYPPAERDDFGRHVERINATLADDPHELGESRDPGRRVWFTGPLMVHFAARRDSLIVTVLYVVRSRYLPDDEDLD